jgi:SAM-dependent methyltransferase
VSGVYERGWRQSFAWAGFPGADAEFQLAMARLGPAFGGTLLDLSCGSGIFSRLFAKSGRFAGVIAADFSEAMLREAAATFAADAAARGGPHLLVRADAARLPFAAGSLGAVHAGAALHCWPDAATAVAEVARVLRPGGAFVASTFLTAAAPLGALLGDDAAVRPLGRLLDGPPGARPMRWWDEGELRGLCAAAGLVGFERERRNRFILFSARKPNRGGDGGDGNESN